MPTPTILGSEEPFLKPSQLAELLNVKASTIVDWCRHHPDLFHLKLVRGVRIRKSDLEAWLQKPR